MAETKKPSVFDQQLIDEVQKKHDKSIEELRQERDKRLWDAVELKVPDRVPVIFGGTFLACKIAGIPYSAAYYDAAGWKQAFKKMIVDMDPDSYGWEPRESGTTLEALQSNYTRWPGGTLPENVPFQIAEKEYMKEDEYDIFLSDPSDYMLRYLIPRTYDALQPLAKLSPLSGMGGVESLARMLVSPEFGPVVQAMKKAGEASIEKDKVINTMTSEMSALGYPEPLPARGGIMPPFSGFSNTFRTFNGVVKDMYRRPEKLKAALQILLDFRIARAVPAVKRDDGRPVLGSCGEAHRVSDEFFSNKQFEEFVWPFWKQAIDKSFELGYEILSMFFEGRRDRQLEYFTQFPKRSMLIRFAESDIFRAKEILGEKACIMGNVPITLLQVGSTTDVEEYVKKLIDKVGKNGGFILRASTDFTQEAKPENVKVMIDTVKKYGRYY
ncbi:MAG: hypothetical protein JW712_12590 [Dehalococcoidales bacterium]|nr:hypothetical protein [Dehalococcoidales bacterium]